MEELTLNNFKRRVRHIEAPRKHKIRGSLGIRDAFLFIQRNKWFDIGRPVTEQQFQRIIREIHNLLADEIMDGRPVIFPEGMGCIEVRKTNITFKKVNGKIKTNYPVDWDKTLELWYNDPEEFKKKTIVRDTEHKEKFKILYNRENANYNNKSYYQFKLGRSVFRIVANNFKQGKFDAFNYGWVYKDRTNS